MSRILAQERRDPRTEHGSDAHAYVRGGVKEVKIREQ